MLHRHWLAGSVLSLSAAAWAQDSSIVTRSLRSAHAFEEQREQDQFADAPAAPQAGAQFVVSMKFSDANEAGVGRSSERPYYTYGAGRLRLQATPSNQQAGPGQPTYPVMSIAHRTKPGKAYMGASAFGAAARIPATWLETDGVAMIVRPQGELSPYSRPLEGVAERRDTYWVEVELPGPLARQVALDARLLLEGSLQPLDGNRITACRTDHGAARIDSPTVVISRTCWIGAHVSRIAIVSRGVTLREWRASAE